MSDLNSIDPCQVMDPESISKQHAAYKKRNVYQTHWGLLSNLRQLDLISKQIGIKFLLLYGALIGQYWNERLLPWDTDVDVSILNVTQYEGWVKTLPKSNIRFPSEHSDDRLYQQLYTVSDDFVIFLDLHPKHHIESRLIHLPSGVYTDITYLHLKDNYYVMKGFEKKLWGGHRYTTKQIEPLRPCDLNNVSFVCPADVESVLRQQYKHFDNPHQMRFYFNSTCWVKFSSMPRNRYSRVKGKIQRVDKHLQYRQSSIQYHVVSAKK